MTSLSGEHGDFSSSMTGRSQKASKWFQKALNIFPDRITENVLIGTKTNTSSKKLVVVGDCLFTGAIEHTGDLVIDGTTLLKGATTLQSTLSVSDTTTLTSLICNNTATFNRQATFTYPVVCNSTLNVGDTTTLTSLICNNTSTFNRLATFNYPVIMNSTLEVSDTTLLTALTTTGETKINSGLTCYSGVDIQGTLSVGDTTTLTSLVCNNTATFNKQATFEFPIVANSTLNVSDTTTLTNLVVSQGATFGGGYGSTGITAFTNGNLSMDGNLVIGGTIGGFFTRGSNNIYPSNVGDTILSNDGYINDSEADATYVNVFKLRNTNESTEVASYSFYLKDGGNAGYLKFELDYKSSVKEIFNIGKDGIMNIIQGTTFTGGYGSTGLTTYAGGHLSMNGNLVVDGTGIFGDKLLITDIANSTYVEVFEMKNTNDGSEVASFSFYVKDSGNDGVIKFEVDYKGAVNEVYYIEKTGILHINQGLKIIDDISITFGNDDNYTLEYDENGFNHLVLRSKKDTDFNFQWASDASDDNTDNYTWYIPLGGSYLGCYSYLGGAWGNSMFNLVPQGTRADDYAEVKNIKVNKYLFTDEIKTMTGDIAIEPSADLNLQCGVDMNIESARILTIKSPSRTIAKATNGFVPKQNDNTWGAGIMVGDEVLTTIETGYPNAGASRRRSFWFGCEQTSGSWRALGIGVNLTNNDDNPTLGYEDTQLLGYFNPADDGSQITFTAYHLCSTQKQDEFIDDNIGLVVESTGIYDSLDPLAGVLPNQIDNIMISESVPQVQLTTTSKSKKVFGVIAKVEKDGEHRHNNISSMFVGVVKKDRNRYNINSIGEGAIWICNEGGNIENGDLLCSIQ